MAHRAHTASAGGGGDGKTSLRGADH